MCCIVQELNHWFHAQEFKNFQITQPTWGEMMKVNLNCMHHIEAF